MISELYADRAVQRHGTGLSLQLEATVRNVSLYLSEQKLFHFDAGHPHYDGETTISLAPQSRRDQYLGNKKQQPLGAGNGRRGSLRAASCARLLSSGGARNLSRPITSGPVVGEPAQRAFEPTDVDVAAILKRLELLPVVEDARTHGRERDVLDLGISPGHAKQLVDC
jgi:hypothetical protein